MITEPELLNERLERLAMVLDEIMPNCALIVRDALALLKEQEDVVRCKDCQHVCMCDTTEMFPDIPVYAKCTLTDEVHEPDWFCADGDKK